MSGRRAARTVDKVSAAYALRLSGATWAQVADASGYPDAAAAAAAVSAHLAGETSAAADAEIDDRQLELARLDALQAAFWPAAASGEPKAAEVVLKVVAQRTKLLGLDQVDAAEPLRTVVIGGSTEEYVAGLKAVIDGTHPGMGGR